MAQHEYHGPSLTHTPTHIHTHTPTHTHGHGWAGVAQDHAGSRATRRHRSTAHGQALHGRRRSMMQHPESLHSKFTARHVSHTQHMAHSHFVARSKREKPQNQHKAMYSSSTNNSPRTNPITWEVKSMQQSWDETVTPAIAFMA
jgi:hypothetical protein